MEKRKKIEGFSVPEEIILQILKELDVKSLLRLRCVSKLWCSIIDDPFFIHLHHTRSLSRPGSINILFRHGAQLYFAGPEGDPPYQLLNMRNLDLLHPQYVTGIILIENYIWNPSTRECITIPPISIAITSFAVEMRALLYFKPQYFLGFDPSTMKYKVLTRCYITSQRGNQQAKSRIEYKILTLGANSNWRDIGDDSIPNQLDEFINNGRFCYISGVIYYLERNSNESVLVAFEVGHEKFRVMSLPRGNNYCSYLIVVREHLALIDEKAYSIWILEDCDKQLWNRQTLVMMYEGKPLMDDGCELKIVPFGTIHTDEILLLLVFVTLAVAELCYYDLESKRLRIVNLGGEGEQKEPYFCTKYVETIFQLKRL